MKPIKCNFCKSDKFGGHEHDCFILTGKHKNIMESEINKRIRETLDKYGVITNGQEK